MDVFENMTEIGRETYKLFEKYGLEEYYQFEMGNLIIYPKDFSINVQSKVIDFLKSNTEYVLGFEESYYFVSRIDDLF